LTPQVTDLLSSRLQTAGLHLSNGDRFVIGAAQALIAHANSNLDFDEIKNHFEKIRLAVERETENWSA